MSCTTFCRSSSLATRRPLKALQFQLSRSLPCVSLSCQSTFCKHIADGNLLGSIIHSLPQRTSFSMNSSRVIAIASSSSMRFSCQSCRLLSTERSLGEKVRIIFFESLGYSDGLYHEIHQGISSCHYDNWPRPVAPPMGRSDLPNYVENRDSVLNSCAIRNTEIRQN